MKTHIMKTPEWQRITQAKTNSWRGLLSFWADEQTTTAPPADAS
jgi:hypothetical protein